MSYSLVQPFDCYPAGIEAAQNAKVHVVSRHKNSFYC